MSASPITDAEFADELVNEHYQNIWTLVQPDVPAIIDSVAETFDLVMLGNYNVWHAALGLWHHRLSALPAASSFSSVAHPLSTSHF